MVTLEKMRTTASDLDRGAESEDLGITLIGSSDYRRAAIFLRDAAKQIEDLTRERDHWKSNHDNQVSRARVLIERLDLPIERVRAYEEIVDLRIDKARLDSGVLVYDTLDEFGEQIKIESRGNNLRAMIDAGIAAFAKVPD